MDCEIGKNQYFTIQMKVNSHFILVLILYIYVSCFLVAEINQNGWQIQEQGEET